MRGGWRSHGGLPTPCSEQKLLAELQGRLQAEEQRRTEAREQLERALRAMQTTKEGLEHLAGKLHQVSVAGPAWEGAPPPTSQDPRGGAATQVRFPPCSPFKGTHAGASEACLQGKPQPTSLGEPRYPVPWEGPALPPLKPQRLPSNLGAARDRSPTHPAAESHFFRSLSPQRLLSSYYPPHEKTSSHRCS